MAAELLELVVADVDEWETWLEAHQHDEQGVWLVLAKKGTTEPTSMTYAQALQVALCFGWIDGQARSRDAHLYIQRFTPRRTRSIWSQRNVGYVEALIADGRMRPRGQAEIDKAKADGRWEAAYAGPAAMDVPDDLTAALRASPGAHEAFEALNRQSRYSILFGVHNAKRAETRARRIARAVEELQGENQAGD